MTSPKWEKVALWLGIFAAVAGFTGYTLKDFFDKDDTEVEQNNGNLERQLLPSDNLVAESSKNNSKRDDKPTKKLPAQEIEQKQPPDTKIEKTNSEPKSPKTENQQFNSKVIDENGKGVSDAEVYCPNCLIKKVKTDFDGNFTLEGHFKEEASFWQSTVTFSKDNKIKIETINWRDKSPQPIKL